MPLRELWRFLRAPGEPMPAFTSRSRAIGFYIHLLLLMLFLQLAWVLLSAGIKAEEGVAYRRLAAEGWTLAMLMILLVPAMEEFMFRSWLTRSVFLPVLLLWSAIRHLMPFVSFFGALQISAYVLAGVALLIRVERLRSHAKQADDILARWLPATVPLSTLVFALTHVPNWDLPATSPWLVPVLVLPQFLSGLMFAYARVRSGLAGAIALHAAINTVVVLVVTMSTMAKD